MNKQCEKDYNREPKMFGVHLRRMLALLIALGGVVAVTFNPQAGARDDARPQTMREVGTAQSLPFRDPEQLARIWERNAELGMDAFSVSAANFADWKAQSRAFAQMAAYRETALRLGDEPILGAQVSANLFSLLGVNPSLGRVFSTEEENAERSHVVVMSHRLWQRRFGGDPRVIGQTITLNGERFTIIGVMPQGFEFPLCVDRPGDQHSAIWNGSVELWTPQNLGAQPERGARFLRVVARLRSNVTLAQAQSEMETIARRLARAHPSANNGWSVTTQSLAEESRRCAGQWTRH